MPLKAPLGKETCRNAEIWAESDAGVGFSPGMVYARPSRLPAHPHLDRPV
jgi:hypothetical protein